MRLPSRAALICLALLAACGPRPAPTPHTPRATPVSAGAVAIDPAGLRLAAVNPDSGSVTLVDLATLTIQAEVALGTDSDPRTLSFTPDSTTLLVAEHGAGTLAVIDAAAGTLARTVTVGALPYGVVAGSSRAYVSLAGAPQVVVVDLGTWAVTAAVPLPPFPTGLALAAGEAALYVTHLYSGAVSVLDTATLTVTQTLAAAPEANLAQFIALSSDGTRAYVPQTLAFSDRTDLAYDNAVRPIVGVLALSGGEPPAPLALSTPEQAVNLPFAVALAPECASPPAASAEGCAARLYVANAGSDVVTVLDPASGATLAALPTGRNPRGLALSADGARLYVDNVLDGTLDVFDTTALSRLQRLTLTRLPLAAEVLEGKRLFNSALEPMAADGWLSCATCHLDGGDDGRTWAGFPDGPRNTPALLVSAASLPLHWNGNLDEFQDTEATIRVIQGGAGLIAGDAHLSLGPANAGRSAALDALAAYLATLTPPPSPYAPDAETLARGERAFARWGCATCHSGAAFSDQQTHTSSIGDAALERNQTGPLPRFDTPALAGAWATAPYFHDGSAATLRDTFFSVGFHNMGPAMNPGEVIDLVAYMQSLP
ncbi:MAG: c-type cytochrome [Anaerolineales bacterium]|nr:c-type cytochrome [Anaerolineales bacterium]